MLEFFQFMFSGFWTFIGCLLIIAVIGDIVAKLIFAVRTKL